MQNFVLLPLKTKNQEEGDKIPPCRKRSAYAAIHSLFFWVDLRTWAHVAIKQFVKYWGWWSHRPIGMIASSYCPRVEVSLGTVSLKYHWATYWTLRHSDGCTVCVGQYLGTDKSTMSVCDWVNEASHCRRKCFECSHWVLRCSLSSSPSIYCILTSVTLRKRFAIAGSY